MAGNSSQIAVALTAVTTTAIRGGRRHGGTGNRSTAIQGVARVYSGVGSSSGRCAAELHDFVQRQVQHIGTLLGLDQHLGHAAVDFLHGIDVQAIARDLGRFLVFRVQRLEALRITLGLRHDTGLVSVRLLLEA